MSTTLPSKNEKRRASTPPAKRVVIFARVGNAQHTGAERAALLAAQQDYCRGVAEALHAEVAKEYAAYGGTTQPAVRQVVEQLLRTVDAGGIDYVIVQSFERLTRRPDDLIQILTRMHANGARLVTTADAAEDVHRTIALYCLLLERQARKKRRSA